MSRILEMNVRLKIDLETMKVVGNIESLGEIAESKHFFDSGDAKAQLDMSNTLLNWEHIKEYVRAEFDIPYVSYNTWIKPLEISKIRNNVVYLKKPMEGAEEYIEKKYFSCIRVAIMDLCGANYTFKFEE